MPECPVRPPVTHLDDRPQGVIAAIVHKFMAARLSVILIIVSAFMGAAALLVTAREEEPQIIVPLADVFVQTPGASAEEVEKLVAAPLEKLLWQIDGVEYVYSVSRPDLAVVTVRFYVGQDRERSLVKLYNKINMNVDQAPPVVKGWVVKPVEIDDVPIVNLTLHSDRYDDAALRRIGEEVLARLSEVEDISRVSLVGGRRREIRVELEPERMAGLGLSAMEAARTLQGADASLTAGTFNRADREFMVTANSFLTSAREVGSLVVALHQGRPVYLRDIAQVIDGPEEPTGYSRIGFSAGHLARTGQSGAGSESRPAVTLALAKKKGTNAVVVAERIHRKMQELKRTILPAGVAVEITRDYGRTAQLKVEELIEALLFAIVTVVALLAFTMGWREALIVALTVPVSFALALFVNYLLGFTINRVTMFALILSLGLVVDDPIANVENIQRHIRMGLEPPKRATLTAVNEVLPPVIIATIAIVISFLPMFFITGMMGPYMAPMAANVPLTVGFSLVCSLTIVPWLAHGLLKGKTGLAKNALTGETETAPPWVRQGYARVASPFLDHRWLRWALFGFILVGLLGSASLAAVRLVPLKMLPFDNKNEFQLVLDLDRGATLEATDRMVRDFEDYLRAVPEVTHFVTYVGEPSPLDFNGLVRHYYLRRAANLADIRVGLADKARRRQQSHEIVLRLRRDLERLAQDHQARLKLVEAPPGPPVVATLVAEVYGDPDKTYAQLLDASRHVRKISAEEKFVVDLDDTAEAGRDRLDFVLDKEKAALHGVTSEVVTATLRLALSGFTPVTLHLPGERQALQVRLTLPRAKRSSATDLGQIPVKTNAGGMIPLAELGRFESVPEDQPIYHKNLRRVVFMFAEMAGRAPAEAVLDIERRLRKDPVPQGIQVDWAGEGEWNITLQVFRDLGLAFAAALIGIYILLVIQTNSFLMPLLIMLAIPLTMLGIMPGFWLLNLIGDQAVGGFHNPVFFTATSMIGMIALGGIVIRNSVVLIDFIRQSLLCGQTLREAIIDSCAVRLRPIFLTSAAAALGAWPITLDPIFSGLAWALIFGLFASTAFTLLVVPVTYYAFYHRKDRQDGP